MRQIPRTIPLAMALSLATVADAAGAAGAPPSPGASATTTRSSVVYGPWPTPPPSLRTSHRRHLERGTVCLACHPGIARSSSVAEARAAATRESDCQRCHPKTGTVATASLASAAPRPASSSPSTSAPPSGLPPAPLAAPPSPRPLPLPALRFSHRLHLVGATRCERCHAGLTRLDLAGSAALPRMSLCLGCHDNRQASAACRVCHPTKPDGTLNTNLPGGRLVPRGLAAAPEAAHGLDFATRHAQAARTSPAYCQSCHRESACLACHAGVLRPLAIHGNDYITLHALDARRQATRCSSCHRQSEFCVGCHQRTGVASESPGRPFRGGGGSRLRFHLQGWAADPPGPGHHASEAQRDLGACVSCHRDRTCIRCHATTAAGGLGRNPHPPGFAGNGRCAALRSRNLRVCLQCHGRGDGALDACR